MPISCCVPENETSGFCSIGIQEIVDNWLNQPINYLTDKCLIKNESWQSIDKTWIKQKRNRVDRINLLIKTIENLKNINSAMGIITVKDSLYFFLLLQNNDYSSILWLTAHITSRKPGFLFEIEIMLVKNKMFEWKLMRS